MENNGRQTTIKEELGVKLARAAQRITQQLQDGKNVDTVDDTTYAIRIGICEGCEFFRTDRHCGRCYCPMDYKAKLLHNPYTLGSSKEEVKCPAGLW